MILITGGAGFIGANLIHYWIETTDDVTIDVDLVYAKRDTVGTPPRPKRSKTRSGLCILCNMPLTAASSCNSHFLAVFVLPFNLKFEWRPGGHHQCQCAEPP